MKLTVIGCSGSFSGPDSAASCYLIEHEGTRLLLDLGSGALGALARHADIYSIDAVALTHLHADHCVDLVGFHVARKYVAGGPRARIPVFGPPGTESRMEDVHGYGSGSSMTDTFDFVEFGGAPVQVGSITVTAHPVVHCVPGFALRVEAGGRSLIYSGDTAPCEELVRAARGADVALFEASYLAGRTNPAGIHMSGADCAAAASAAGVDRLILTHLVPWNDPAQVLADAAASFDRDLKLAHSGLVEEI